MMTTPSKALLSNFLSRYRKTLVSLRSGKALVICSITVISFRTKDTGPTDFCKMPFSNPKGRSQKVRAPVQ